GAAPAARRLSRAVRGGYEQAHQAQPALRGRGTRRPCHRSSQPAHQPEATAILAPFRERRSRFRQASEPFRHAHIPQVALGRLSPAQETTLSPLALTTTSAIAAGSRTRLPFNVASAFHGAPKRIQRRCAANRARSVCCKVRMNSGVPCADPCRTSSQQGPREATMTNRATRARRGVPVTAGGACRVVVGGFMRVV